MCLILNLSHFLYSPLEQFEISSYNTFLNYTTSFPLEILEFNFYPTINFIETYTIIDLIFILSIVYLLQTNLKQNGYLHLFIFIYICLVGFNFISFNDVLVQNFFLETTLPASYFNVISTNFEYVTISTSFLNIYSVLFCFIFIYIIIYLIFNKMLSNNTNTLIPNLYQIIGESLYKVSLNLFYSILGKHVSIPEFFLKINTIFVFLVISNVQGMIPYMSTLTSALTNTFFIALALFISIITTLLDKKGINYFLNLFMPSGCPILLSLLIIPIEVISYSFRLVSLSVRLFANMMAGHTLLKVIVGFS
jgi:F-type H+-transporting ATPase subunit a